MARPRKTPAEEMTASYQRRDAADLARIVAEYNERFPADWDALRLCPLAYGIEAMIEKLNR